MCEKLLFWFGKEFSHVKTFGRCFSCWAIWNPLNMIWRGTAWDFSFFELKENHPPWKHMENAWLEYDGFLLGRLGLFSGAIYVYIYIYKCFIFRECILQGNVVKVVRKTLHVAWRLANLEAKPASQENKHHICECGPCWRHCKSWGKRTSQIHPIYVDCARVKT